MTVNRSASPAHDIDHLDGIYRSVEALIDSLDDGDSDLAVALPHEDECPPCFSHALFPRARTLAALQTTAVAVDMAKQHPMTCLEVALLPATAMEDLITL